MDGIDNDGNGYIDDQYGLDIETKTGDTTRIGDDCGHGTMVADIIANSSENIKLFGIRAGINDFLSIFYPDQSQGGYARIEEAISNGLNMTESPLFHYSGGMSHHDCKQTASNLFPNATGEQIIQKCQLILDEWKSFWEKIVDRNPDVTFVFSAGNFGMDNDSDPTYPCNLDNENVICAANVKKDGDSVVLHDSNFGRQSVDVAIIGRSPQAACGGTTDKFGSIGKTSGAAAHVSNLIAEVLLQNPTLKPKEVNGLLTDSSQSIPNLNGKVKSNGMIDNSKAILSGRLSLPLGNNVPKVIEEVENQMGWE